LLAPLHTATGQILGHPTRQDDASSDADAADADPGSDAEQSEHGSDQLPSLPSVHSGGTGERGTLSGPAPPPAFYSRCLHDPAYDTGSLVDSTEARVPPPAKQPQSKYH
jgi:hypothetical protein